MNRDDKSQGAWLLVVSSVLVWMVYQAALEVRHEVDQLPKIYDGRPRYRAAPQATIANLILH